MLLRLSIENWMSFEKQASFSMLASREQQHGEHVSRVAKYPARILPLAAIYGGNASGKTNLFQALQFAKWLVVTGTQPDNWIPVIPFALGASNAEKPSRFCFELLVDEYIYEFSFTVTREAVLEEKLVKVVSTSEKTLYERKAGEIKFQPSLAKDDFLQFAFRGTRDNQLFLTNAVSQKVDLFRPVYDWFKDNLELVAPASRFEPFERFLDDSQPLSETMNEMLPQLDTGISHLSGDRVPLDSVPHLGAIMPVLNEELKEGITLRMRIDPHNERYLFTREGGEIVARKIFTYHPKAGGGEVKFEMSQESDGSKRIIDLLPAFQELMAPGSKKVYMVDELDRSIHSLLLRRLVEAYLATCGEESRTQLFFTTHDVSLMTQDLLRRDEMWVTERDAAGNTSLFSFSEYKDVRNDKDVRKSYLQGRLGGVPRLTLVPNDEACSGAGGKKG